MNAPTLLLVAHGSVDPRATGAAQALVRQVSAARPDLAATVGFLDHAEPAPAPALAVLPPGPVVVVPLLLAHAYHATDDIQQVATDARRTGRRVAVAAVLGPDPLLLDAAEDLLQRAGVAAGTPVVLASAGTSSAPANAATVGIAAELARRRGAAVVSAYASAAEPTVRQAISALGGRPAVLRWLLFPGRFADAVSADAEAAGCTSTDVLAGSERLAELVLARYDAAAEVANGV
ncbi:MAG TPA: CbiX/SirB N-terminal domain-containing protein [Mycobacteriales bacterium]|nr:CbiX/SirB N-terminal domain-containing protein [Mycobacteriales bacterium]